MEERHCWLAGFALAVLSIGIAAEKSCNQAHEARKARIASCQAAGGYMEEIGATERCFSSPKVPAAPK